jgi:hypothetical protein
MAARNRIRSKVINKSMRFFQPSELLGKRQRSQAFQLPSAMIFPSLFPNVPFRS